MTTIEQIQAINQSKIADKEIKEMIQTLLNDYERAYQKKPFLQLAQANMDELYGIVKMAFPAALKKDESETPKKTEKKASTEKKTIKKATPEPKQKANPNDTELEREMKEYEESMAYCKKQLSEYNKRKRESMPPKPKPTRYKKISNHLLGLANLIPKPLKNDEDVRKATEKVLLKTHQGLMKAFQMSSKTKAEATEKAITEKLEPNNP